MDIAATLEAFIDKVDLLYLTDVIGIVAFAFAGVLIGIRMKCDPVGIFVLAFSTAFGGGIMRDLLIDRRPMYWIANQELVWLVLLITIFTPMLFRFYKKHLSYDVFVWCDAIGLGFFSAVGTSHGVNLGVPYLPAVLCGVATGVFGGLCRDAFLNIKPSLIYDHQPYGSVAFAGCWLFIAMIALGIDNTLSIWVASLFITFFRMWCYYRSWRIAYHDNFIHEDPSPETDRDRRQIACS